MRLRPSGSSTDYEPSGMKSKMIRLPAPDERTAEALATDWDSPQDAIYDVQTIASKAQFFPSCKHPIGWTYLPSADTWQCNLCMMILPQSGVHFSVNTATGRST